MYNDQEILEILESAISVEKDYKKPKYKKKYDKYAYKEADYPDYYPEYSKIVELFYETKRHSDMDFFPVELFKNKAPNQNPAEFDYERENYKAVTVPFWGKAESAIGRIWNRDNYKIDLEKDSSKYTKFPAKEYFETGLPFYGSILNFFETIVTKSKIRDPNAILCIKPHKLPVKEDENGDLIIDDSKLIIPFPVVYNSPNIIAFEEEQYALVLTAEKSIVMEGNTKTRKGRVFEFYDEQSIYKVIQYGKYTDELYRVELYYEHNLGWLPASKLKGVPIQKDSEKIYYESSFRPSIPSLDEALIYNSTLKLSTITQAFPQRWEIVEKCSAAGCVGGKVFKEGKHRDCETCGGTGKPKQSPTGTLEVSMPNKLEQGNQIPIPPFGYEAPDIKVLDFLDSKKDRSIIQAFCFANIDVSDTIVKGTETATEKVIDREEFFSFLITFSNEIFDLLIWTYKTMGSMRYDDFKEPTIVKPSNFTLRTYTEITEEISTAKDSGIPDIAVYNLLKEYVKARFGVDKQFGKIMEIVIKIDSLITKSDMEIGVLLSNRLITRESAILHRNILQYIDEILIENPKFLDEKIDVIKQKLMAMVEKEPVLIDNTNEGLLAEINA